MTTTPASSTWPTNAHDHLTTIIDVAMSLRALSDAFRITGNYTVATNLRECANDIQNAATAAGESIREHISADFDTAQSMSGTILRSVLAGAELERKTR